MPLNQFPKAFSNSLVQRFHHTSRSCVLWVVNGNGENTLYFLTEQASDTASSLAIHTTDLAYGHSPSLGLLSQIIFKLKMETREGIDESVFHCLITPGLVPPFPQLPPLDPEIHSTEQVRQAPESPSVTWALPLLYNGHG